MEAKKIIDAIQSAVEKETLTKIQQGDLTALIENYSELFNEYKELSEEDKNKLFDEVKKQRPLIGKNLKEQFEKDLFN